MGINRKNDSDDNILIAGIAFFKWIQFFLAPVFLFGLIGMVIIFYGESQLYEYVGVSVIIIGIVCGVLFAEYLRKKFGLIEFDARDEATPDIDEWLEKEREKFKK